MTQQRVGPVGQAEALGHFDSLVAVDQVEVEPVGDLVDQCRRPADRGPGRGVPLATPRYPQRLYQLEGAAR